jgi:enediyne biosynthesis protein E4
MRSRLGIRRRPAALVGAAAIVAIVGVAIVGYGLGYFGASSTPTAGGTPHFVEQTAGSGLSHTYGAGDAYVVGGGVAVFDCNGDGRPDVYLAGGSNPAAVYRNDSSVGGDLKFTRLPDAATDLTGVEGAYPIDIDGDGNVDLAVLRLGETELLRGLGGCRFQAANAAWSFDGGNDYTTAFSATWEGSNALPTLAVGHYLKLDATGTPTLDCADNLLFRPKADGSGFDKPIVLTPGYCSLSMLFSDWDLSGRRDLRISNDRNYYVNGQDQLWRVAPGERPRLYTDADGWVSMQIFGMGIAEYDVNGDGYPDYYLTSQGDNRLQTLAAGPDQPSYRDIAFKRGVVSTRPNSGGQDLPSTSWHPEFQDVNNDGFVDLFVSKGNVNAQPGFATKDPSDLFLGQPDGTFKQEAVAAGIAEFDRGRGAALADFNLDGLPDLIEVHYGAPVRIWLNAGSGDAARPGQMGNWLDVRPTQKGPNPDAIGAWIEVKVGDATMRRELTIGGGHAGGQLGWTHFGLGPAGNAQVRVKWPDGQTGPWIQVAANQFVYLDRGATEARPWSPPKV